MSPEPAGTIVVGRVEFGQPPHFTIAGPHILCVNSKCPKASRCVTHEALESDETVGHDFFETLPGEECRNFRPMPGEMNIMKGESNHAVQVEKPGQVDVCKPAPDGEALGRGNAGGPEGPAGTCQEEKRRPEKGAGRAEVIAVLKFKLPEEQDEFDAARRGGDCMAVLDELERQSRNWDKYGHEFESANDAVKAFRALVADLMEEYGRSY